MTRNNFDKMYQLWVDKFKINFKFNPKNMNAIFKQMDEIKKVEKSKVINYNELVRNFFGNSFAN